MRAKDPVGAGSPELLLESLVMTQQFSTARRVLDALPSLHDDAMLLTYGRSATSTLLKGCPHKQL